MKKYRPRMDAGQREARRIEAVRRLRAGEHAAVVAADLGVEPSTVYRWGKLARENGGLRALKGTPKSGRPPKLDRSRWAQLKRMILKGPRDCGFARELWTLPMVKQLIAREFGVDYHDDHLSKFMRKLGLSAQKPMVRAKERDEKAIKTFVEVEFPKIEKKRGVARPR